MRGCDADTTSKVSRAEPNEHYCDTLQPRGLANETLCKPKRAGPPHVAKRQSLQGGKIATQRERDEILTQAA
ncbi:MAG: hypothetical protein ACFNVQ_04255 [Campylobacter sp.]